MIDRSTSGARLSSRAIAAVIGVSHQTILRDLEAGEQNCSPDTVTGQDGKKYRSRPLPTETRLNVIGMVHYLSHTEGLSLRAISERIWTDHHLRRSIGSLSADLTTYRCSKCSGVPNPPPEQQVQP